MHNLQHRIFKIRGLGLTRIVELPVSRPLPPDLDVVSGERASVVAHTIDISVGGDSVLTHNAQQQIKFVDRMGLLGAPQMIRDDPRGI